MNALSTTSKYLFKHYSYLSLLYKPYIIFGFNFEGHPCPEEHQFAFGNGDSCCKYQEDENGHIITDQSTSCKDKNSISCPTRPCVDNYGNVFVVFPNMDLFDHGKFIAFDLVK